MFYLCESVASATNVFCSESEASAANVFCSESEASAAKRPAGTEINPRYAYEPSQNKKDEEIKFFVRFSGVFIYEMAFFCSLIFNFSSISTVIFAKSYCALKPHSFCAASIFIEFGQLSAIA